MAIKGKGKTKNRQPARAPRRAPVPVKPPLFARRWVQVVAALLIGMGIVWFLVWVTNGIRASREADQAAKTTAQQKAALQQWQSVVEQQVGTVGQLQQQGVPPTIAPQVAATGAALAAGKPPTTTSADLKSSAAALQKAAKTMTTFNLSTTIRSKGFTTSQADGILTAQTHLADALSTYQQAALLAALAVDSSDAALQKELGTRVKALTMTADAEVQEGWRLYTNALSNVGLLSGSVQSSGNTGGLPTGLGG
ncbi:MAG: hypothetical protein ACM3OO_07895 [Planctomycetaceae bacterium]